MLPLDMTHADKPLITIIVAVVNGAKTLQRCIASVNSQTYSFKELIIIDGGSTDGTVGILKENKDIITYWESEPDRGISHAWNKALAHARGEWISFLGADDYFWQSDVITHIVPHLIEAVASVRVVYGPINLVKGDGTIIGKVGSPWNRRNFCQLMCIPHPGVFHHRSLFEVHGCFDESLRIAGDYDLLLRELKTGNAIFIPDIIIAGMQYGGRSSDVENSLRMLCEIARSRKKNGIHGFPLLLYYAYMKAHVRRLLMNCIGNRNSRHVANLYRRLKGRPQI